MLLHDLLGGGAAPTDPPVEVSAVVIDDRQVASGALFACIVGTRHDGHDHAASAVARGAVALLVERPVAGIAATVPQIVVPSVRAAIGPIAARLAGDPSRDLAIVGVTGTNGKTTVTHLLESIVRAAGRRPGVLGTLGARWDGGDSGIGFTTPEAPALHGLLAAMRADAVDVVAMEVSSHALDQHRVDGTHFAAVGFTNLTPEHLDLHGTLDEYFAAKARLFAPEFAPHAVIDVDSDAGRRLVELAQARGLDVTTVGLSDAGADVRTIACRCAAAGSQVVVARRNAADLMFELPLLGAFNVANALVAVGLAAAIGIGDDAIRAGLAAVAPVPGRLEVVADPAGRIVVVDYAHTPDALTTVLTTLRDLAPTARIVTVYGCGGDRDAAKRPLMGAAVAAGADAAVLTSDNPRSEDPAAIAAAVIGGLDADDPHPEVILDRRAAIARAITLTGPGDVVLVAGKGHERGQTALGVTTPFDDRLVAAELLAAAGREPGTGAACA